MSHRAYYPRYFVVRNSGFSGSSKDYARAKKGASLMRTAGWSTTIIKATSHDEAVHLAQGHWDRCAEQRKRELERKEPVMSDMTTSEDRAKLVGAELYRLVNVLGSGEEIKPIVERFLHEHRTIQQGLMRHLVFPLIEGWAAKKDLGDFDLRNQATVETAATMRKALPTYVGFPTV